jgi:hypothetical protein
MLEKLRPLKSLPKIPPFRLSRSSAHMLVGAGALPKKPNSKSASYLIALCPYTAIQLQFVERERERTQEFTVRWASAEAGYPKDLFLFYTCTR